MTTATLTDADVRFRDKVMRQSDWDPEVDASAGGVAAENGTVTLTGSIGSHSGRLAAERAALHQDDGGPQASECRTHGEQIMRTFAPSLVFMTAVTVGVPAAFAQPEPRAAVSASVGVGSGSSDTGVAVGGALLFDVHERLSVEGQGIYLGRGKGADAFTAGGAVLINLLPASESLVPYAAIGGGVYHVSFDLAHPRFLGPVGGQFGAGTTVCPAPGRGFGFGPGPGFGAGTGTCSAPGAGYWGVGALPNFYARRLGPLVFPPGGAWETRTFTDPVVSIGGGIRFNVSDRLMIRPDARALVVLADGHTHTLGVFVVHIAYRF